MEVDGKVLLICMQVCSLVARMCFGPIADFEIIRKNRMLLQQVSSIEFYDFYIYLIIIKPNKFYVFFIYLFLILQFLDILLGHGDSYHAFKHN